MKFKAKAPSHIDPPHILVPGSRSSSESFTLCVRTGGPFTELREISLNKLRPGRKNSVPHVEIRCTHVAPTRQHERNWKYNESALSSFSP